MARKPTEIVNFTLRFREDLRKRLERAAEKAERSLNIEIVERLEASFAAEEKDRERKEIGAKLVQLIEGMDELNKQKDQILDGVQSSIQEAMLKIQGGKR